jgi:hypothetical protein
MGCELGLNVVKRVARDAERGENLAAGFFSFALLLFVTPPRKTAA